MSTIYSLYKELCPPTGIDHAVSARFTGPTHNNLIIARGYQLQIYLVVEEEYVPVETQAQDEPQDILDQVKHFKYRNLIRDRILHCQCYNL